MRTKNNLWIILLALLQPLLFQACKTSDPSSEKPAYDKIEKNMTAQGTFLEIRFTKGSSHNHPLMVFWLEDMQGNFIQTLYIARSIGTGIFEHGKAEQGHWEPGAIQRPAALPVWGHKRGQKNKYGNYLPTPEDPVADAYTGATPQQSFVLHVKTEQPIKEKVKLRMEINQSWDWNEFWTNNKYPENKDYKTSSQPALVYETLINPAQKDTTYNLQPIGHSHYSGNNGKIYEDLSTLTTAQKIARSVTVKIKQGK